VVVSWPVSVTPLFHLMQATKLNGPWSPVSSVIVGSQNQATLSTSSGASSFYQLQLITPFGEP
jgi:hypothetical protein